MQAPSVPAHHIGDYHAIGSKSLPLLSAAHISRLAHHNGLGSPSSARQHGAAAAAAAGAAAVATAVAVAANGNGKGTGNVAAGMAAGSGAVNPPEPVHQTDTASIRRRYMALERGEGWARRGAKSAAWTNDDSWYIHPGTPTTSHPLQHLNEQTGKGATPDPLFLLGGLGPDAFFQSNVALEFDNDSPHFRRRLRAMDENVDGVRRHLQRLVGIVQRYIEAGLAFSAVGREFASELMHLVCAFF